MRFRIEETRTYGATKRFNVARYNGWWPYGEWINNYYREGTDIVQARFDSLDQARAWIKEERKRLKDKKKEEEVARERTKPIYHRP